MVLGVPIHVTKIRAGRKVPGLRPQHSATIKILGEICSAEVEGGDVGSTELTFSPGEVEDEPRVVQPWDGGEHPPRPPGGDTGGLA